MNNFHLKFNLDFIYNSNKNRVRSKIMPIVSKGYILDSGLDESDKSISLLFEAGNPLMCTLTHVDMTKNCNKFYILHALHTAKGFILYSRSGRTGNKGRVNQKEFLDAPNCVLEFKSLFKKLTANIWEFRDRFEHRMGYYAVFSYGEKTPDFAEFIPPPIPVVVQKSAMDKRLEYLVDLFCSKQTIDNALDMMDIEYDKSSNGICKADLDADKMPVGMITQRNLQMAKLILDELRLNLEGLTPEKITRYSEKYYSYIPLKASRGHPPKLDNLQLIDDNLDKLEDLSNITRTLELIDSAKAESVRLEGSGTANLTMNETLYKSMNHNIVPLETDSFIYNKIIEMMRNSHGSTHHFKLTPIQIYEVCNPKQKEIYDKNWGNSSRKELLVHGSRLSNWRSILEKGLLLDPSKVGAPITGKMFGNGIYWANSFSKSANYCSGYMQHKKGQKEIICLALGEVAVGNQLKCAGPGQYNKTSIAPHDSVWGTGSMTPSFHYDYNGVHIPTGTLTSSTKGGLFYDEKIIYDQSQYHFRYLVIAEMR
jgi:poly [ADP-ribose] polymerase